MYISYGIKERLMILLQLLYILLGIYLTAASLCSPPSPYTDSTHPSSLSTVYCYNRAVWVSPTDLEDHHPLPQTRTCIAPATLPVHRGLSLLARDGWVDSLTEVGTCYLAQS